MALVFRLCLVVALILAVYAAPPSPHQKRTRGRQVNKEMLRELEELLTEELEEMKDEEGRGMPKAEKKSYGPPEGWSSSQSASQAMRAFSRASKRTQQSIATMLAKEEEFARSLQSLSDDEEVIRRVINFHIETRADPHPSCTHSFDCTNTRVYVDGKEYRKANGSCNNLQNEDYASASVQHQRVVEPTYSVWQMQTRGVGRVDLPNARHVSNALYKADSTIPSNTQGISMTLFQFLQFLDHDLILTPEGEVTANKDCCSTTGGFCMGMFVDGADDVFRDGYCMDARRSFTYLRVCDGSSEQQNQINDITGWVDASNIYGSSIEEQELLRTESKGQLWGSNDDFLGLYTGDEAIPCDKVDDDAEACFNAGDHRVNVINSLTAMHTFWQREHNRIALFLYNQNPSWSDEKIFQIARKIVAAEMQHIVYNEVLPIVLDSDALDDYDISSAYTYDNTINPSITSGFAMAFRFGHMLVPDVIVIDGVTYNVTFLFKKGGEFLMKDHFTMINKLQDYLDTTLVKDRDEKMVNSLRNGLFYNGEPDDLFASFDLGALNTQRSRDWATGRYTAYKEYCGFGSSSSWDDIEDDTHTPEMVTILSGQYNDVNDVDLFPGIISETKIGTSLLGKVGTCIIGKQFGWQKHGDRFWYETLEADIKFTTDQLTEIKKTTMAGVICMNSDVENIPENVFLASSTSVSCDVYKQAGNNQLDLTEWANE